MREMACNMDPARRDERFVKAHRSLKVSHLRSDFEKTTQAVKQRNQSRDVRQAKMQRKESRGGQRNVAYIFISKPIYNV